MQMCRVVGDIFWGLTPCSDPGLYKSRGPMKKHVNLSLERALAKASLFPWKQWLHVPWHIGLMVFLFFQRATFMLLLLLFFSLSHLPITSACCENIIGWGMGGFRSSIKCQNQLTLSSAS